MTYFLRNIPLIKAISIPKETWIGWLSSMFEAYNMSIFSFMAPFLAKGIFREEGSWNGVLFSYLLVFIGSCLFYPIGAIYFGWLGDRKGRQMTCTYSTLGLALITGMIGLIPVSIFGNYTWICFLLLICLQHFFSGGEYHGSIVFSLEHIDQKKNSLVSGICCFFAVLGLITANGLTVISSLMQNEIYMRGCFLIGSMGGLISYVLKNRCQETPAFTSISKKPLSFPNGKSFLIARWQKMSGVVLILAFFIVMYSFIFIFLPLVSKEHQAFNTFKSLILYGVMLILAGYIADRWGMRRAMLAGALFVSIFIVPLFYFYHHFLLIQLTLTLFSCLLIGPIHSWILYQFRPEERCRGIFMSSAIATSLFGGSTVPICMMIYETFHSMVICSLYPLIFAISSLIYLISRKEQNKAKAWEVQDT